MIEFPRRWQIYAYISRRGVSVVQDWASEIKGNKVLLARLNQKLDLLERNGNDLPTGLLTGTSLPHIDKLRIFGPGQTWRFMVCRGPISNDLEFTLLYVAREKDRKLIPPDAYQRAEDNRQRIITDPSRRIIHERIS